MPKPVRLAILDTSVIIDPPDDLSPYAEAVAVAAVSIGELAFGLHVADPIKRAEREQRYRETLMSFNPVPYNVSAAHWFGAIAAAVRGKGRNPRRRTSDLMIAATAKNLGAAVLTRNPDDFDGLEGVVEVVRVDE